MDMARKVLTRLTASAPAPLATLAMWATEVTLGESLTMSGRVEAILARRAGAWRRGARGEEIWAGGRGYSGEPGSAPKAMPPAWTLGQTPARSNPSSAVP